MSMVTATKKDGTKFNPPTFSRWYMFTTTTQKNDKGTFYVPTFLDGGWVDAETYKSAKLFREWILAGKVEVRHEQGASEETSEY